MTQNHEHARTQRDEAQQARDYAEATKLKLQKQRMEIDRELHDLAVNDRKSPEDLKRKRTLDTEKLDIDGSQQEAHRELQRKEQALAEAESHLRVAELEQETDDLIGANAQEMEAALEEFASKLDAFCKDALEGAQEHDRKVQGIIEQVNAQKVPKGKLKTNGNLLSVETEEGSVMFQANSYQRLRWIIEKAEQRFKAVQQQAAREQDRQQEEAERQAEEERQKAHQEWLQSPEGQLEQARLASKYQWQGREEPGMQVSDLKGVGAQ